MANRKMLCVAASATRGNARENEGWKTRLACSEPSRPPYTRVHTSRKRILHESLRQRGPSWEHRIQSVASCCTLHTKYTERVRVCSALRTRSEPDGSCRVCVGVGDGCPKKCGRGSCQVCNHTSSGSSARLGAQHVDSMEMSSRAKVRANPPRHISTTHAAL